MLIILIFASMNEINSEELSKIYDKSLQYLIVAQPEDIPTKLKEWRTYRDLSIRKVSELTGISNSYISQLENGKIKEPSFSVIVKLCDCYVVRLKIGS